MPTLRSFQKYHLTHHRFQGEITRDPDLPLRWEAEFFTTPLLKFIFLCLQPFIYTLRPIMAKSLPTTNWEVAQWVFQLSVDAVVVYTCGWKSMIYLLISTLFGASFHPLAGHFVAEHYEWVPGYETYSYYGIMNRLTYNVGYHNEHHDFPRIPGSRLPELHRIAPEYYENLPTVSWIGVMWRFIWDPKITPYCRTVRDTITHGQRDANGKPLTD